MNQPLSILLLCGDTSRARAYASKLQSLFGVKITGLIYGVDTNVSPKEPITPNDNTAKYLNDLAVQIPNLNRNIIDAFIENDWEYIVEQARDVNSEVIISKINSLEADIVIFAGYGGQLLSKEHFANNRQYLHCHPGWLPLERGSTTLYYSILNDRDLSVTAFFMTAEIDKGKMVIRNNYPQPKTLVNIDTWVDNCLRADCLFQALEKIISGFEGFSKTKEEKEEEFYVIHPLLKHIALLSLKNTTNV